MHIDDLVVRHGASGEAGMPAVVRVCKDTDAVAGIAEGGVEVRAALSLNDVDHVVGVLLHPIQRAAESS